jgi:hypothetical protein
MERTASPILRYLVDLRSILLAFAIFNFTTTWMTAGVSRDRMCTLGPYPNWLSYLIEPTMLLIASLFLSMNRRWGNAIALFVSGFLLYADIRLRLNYNPLTSLEDWTHSEILYLNKQLFFTLIVFSYSAFSLTKNFLSRKVTAPAG